MSRGAASAMIGLLLAACALGPDYERPAQDLPERHYRDSPGGGAAFGEQDWSQVYADPVLQALIREALAANYDLRIAAANVDAARAALGSARIGQLPQISGRGGVSRAKDSADFTAAGQDRLGDEASAGLSLSWELDLWGRLRRLSEAARAELLEAEYARRGVQIGLIAEVATAYYTLQSLDQKLEITRRTIDTRENFLKLTRAQFQRGVISGLDVASAEAQLASARAGAHALESQRAQAEDALSLLLGRNPGAVARGGGGEATLPAETPPGLPSRLLERRPDVLQAEQALVAANARVGAAKAALFPTLSLTGALGALSSDVSRLFDSGTGTWSAGVGLVQPLLDADRNAYQVDLADARKRAALLGYELAVRNGFREVADALAVREQSVGALREQNAQVDALRRALDISRARYQIGYSSYFEVITADTDLFSAELARAQAELDSQLAVVQLYRALGGGWSGESVSAAP